VVVVAKRILPKFILEVGGAVCVLCKVDMETFGVFTIGVVGGTEEPDVHGIMRTVVKLWKIKVGANTEVHKNTLVLVERIQAVLEKRDGFRGV
jgi:hypothetical protein